MHSYRMLFILILSLCFTVSHGQCPSDTLLTTVISYTPYTWSINGTTYDQSAQVEVTDSDCTLQQLNLTIQDAPILAQRIFSCGPYYWAESGQTYSTSGTYTHAATDTAGDPITYELTLTIDVRYATSSGTVACSNLQWHELELPVGDGEGESVGIDGSGTVIAIGNSQAGTNGGGAVSILQWSSAGWVQLGDTLLADSDGDNFGHAVSLSTNGQWLAVGAPYAGGTRGYVKTYKWSGEQWIQAGEKLEGITAYDEFGFSLDLNNDGSVLIVGAQSSNRVAIELGEARVYQWVGNDWAQMGAPLYKYEYESIPDNHGSDVAISGDGQTVMVGAWYARHSNGSYAGGKHLIYDWDGSSWQERSVFYGYRRFMQIGRAVTLNEDGSHWASAGGGDRTGSGIVFASQGAFGELHGDVTGDRFGRALSLNQQGNILAVSAAQNDDVAPETGKLAVYRYSGGKWNQLGQTLYGEVETEQFGTSLELNADGNVLIVGTNKGVNAEGDPVIGTHVYYLGCATATTSCPEAVVYAHGEWSNTTGPTTGDVVYIADHLSISEDMEIGDLTVAAEVSLTVNAEVTLDVKGDLKIDGELVVNSGGSLLTYEGNDFQGEVTFKRTTRYADGRYSFVGSPLVNDWTQQASVFGPTVYRYDQYQSYQTDGLNRWVDAATYYLVSYLGFAAAGQKEITLTGVLNMGTQEATLAYTEDATTTADNWGWHLLSNPYGAALDVSAFLAGNAALNGFVALWDDPGSDQARGTNEDYLIVNELGMVSGPNGGLFTGYIGVMQGFFVQMAGANGTVTFTENMRVTGHNADSTFLRQAEANKRFWLVMSDQGGNYSETLIGFHHEATAGRDRRFDATRLKAQSNFNLFSILDNSALAIQGLPVENATIPIGHDLAEKETVSISIRDSSMPDGVTLTLRDKRTGLAYLLENEPVHLSLEAGTLVDQLELVIDFGAVQKSTLSEKVRIETHEAYWNVGLEEMGDRGAYQLLNLTGQELAAGELRGEGLRLQKPTVRGVYLLRLNVGASHWIRKLVVK